MMNLKNQTCHQMCAFDGVKKVTDGRTSRIGDEHASLPEKYHPQQHSCFITFAMHPLWIPYHKTLDLLITAAMIGGLFFLILQARKARGCDSYLQI